MSIAKNTKQQYNKKCQEKLGVWQFHELAENVCSPYKAQ